jgi:hypothetical protein
VANDVAMQKGSAHRSARYWATAIIGGSRPSSVVGRFLITQRKDEMCVGEIPSFNPYPAAE